MSRKFLLLNISGEYNRVLTFGKSSFGGVSSSKCFNYYYDTKVSLKCFYLTDTA